jgi:hypothetical protein
MRQDKRRRSVGRTFGRAPTITAGREAPAGTAVAQHGRRFMLRSTPGSARALRAAGGTASRREGDRRRLIAGPEHDLPRRCRECGKGGIESSRSKSDVGGWLGAAHDPNLSRWANGRNDAHGVWMWRRASDALLADRLSAFLRRALRNCKHQ